MKIIFKLLTLSAFSITSLHLCAQTGMADGSSNKATGQNLYLDVHQLEPGKVKYEDVAKAHAKDLAVEKKYGVHFIKYWVNEDKRLVYCLSSSADSESIRKTHAEAHGLLPDHIYQVTDGTMAALDSQKNFFLDVHYLGAGNVTEGRLSLGKWSTGGQQLSIIHPAIMARIKGGKTKYNSNSKSVSLFHPKKVRNTCGVDPALTIISHNYSTFFQIIRESFYL